LPGAIPSGSSSKKEKQILKKAGYIPDFAVTKLRTSPMTVHTDEHLLQDLQQNQIDKAVAELYSLYHESVTSLVIGMGALPDDAEDVFQDTILSFVNTVRSGRFRGESSIKTFMVAIARHLWMNEMRSRKRRDERNKMYSSLEQLTTAAPQDAIIVKSDAIEKLFDKIGDICKKLLTGFYFEKKSMKDLLAETAFQNEQVLRNKKVKCLKHVKDLLQLDPTLTEELKTFLYHE
jgi:RNA polymerase sigma factor (sigma-70 family)